MLSRGKLVQDWRRRLAAAEVEEQEQNRLRWLFRMRVRLYRFLLSCYRQGDWRADEPSSSADETLADVSHGDTTTLLDCPLDGKPAKTSGKMQAVLKSVSAAQDHPPQSGPLLGGLAADEWVVAVSARDKLRMERCQHLLRQNGIVSTWTLQEEIKVRLFDLGRAMQLIRRYREGLSVKSQQTYDSPRSLVVSSPDWSARLVLLIFFVTLYAVCGLLFTQCALTTLKMPLIEGSQVGACLVIWYFVALELSVLTMVLRDVRRRNHERRETRKLAEKATEVRSTEY